MGWLTWRQHRLQVTVAAALVGLLVVFLAITQAQMTGQLHTGGLAACLTSHGECGLAAAAFHDRFSGLLTVVAYLQLLPMLVGLFWGAPLLARELESGTHRLAWTQSVTPRHWLLVKLGWLCLTVIAAGAVLTVLLSWWSVPFQEVDGVSRMQPDQFSLQGIAPIAYALYAFALGVTAGAATRRTLPAMGITLAAYLAIRVPLADWRGRLLPPLRLAYPAGATSPRAGRGDWILPSGTFTDGAGHNIDGGSLQRLCGGSVSEFHRCLAAHHIWRIDLYQPASRFWPLQAAESGIYLGLAAALLVITCWWTLRRLS